MLSWILVVHFIADFVGQTDAMAVNKSKSFEWLLKHVVAYTAIFALLGAFPVAKTAESMGLLKTNLEDFRQAIGWLIAANGVLHMITDAITSRLSAKMWAANRRHAFFVVIGADQLVHQLCLILTTTYVFDKCLNFS